MVFATNRILNKNSSPLSARRDSNAAHVACFQQQLRKPRNFAERLHHAYRTEDYIHVFQAAI